jgi:hypothetical protein
MANQKLGSVWQSGRGTTPPAELRSCDATNTPVENDLVGFDAEGECRYVADAPVAATSIYGICVSSSYANAAGWQPLNNPGYTAPSGGAPGLAVFGGRGSRAASMSPAVQRFIVPISKSDRFLLTPSADTGVVGTAYGIDRAGAGDYRVDIADTANAIVELLGFYDRDVASGAAVRRVWVKFLTVRD